MKFHRQSSCPLEKKNSKARPRKSENKGKKKVRKENIKANERGGIKIYIRVSVSVHVHKGERDEINPR